MRHDKELIFRLREEKMSYRQIQRETGVSRATLVAWFKDLDWSRHVTATNRNENRSASKERIRKMNDARRAMLKEHYDKVEREALEEYQKFKTEALFWAGLMAYAGEGEKRTKGHIRITNTEFYIHAIFIAFSAKYLGMTRDRIKVALLLSPDDNESLCREMWSNLLGIKRENFHKTQILRGKEKAKRLQYGIGMSILSSTALKKKLLVWLSLAQDEKFEAAMV